MPKDQQIDKGKMRQYIGAKPRKVAKKLHTRKLRYAPLEEIPKENRYTGWIM